MILATRGSVHANAAVRLRQDRRGCLWHALRVRAVHDPPRAFVGATAFG